jgi:hypothetical protein
MQKSYLMFEEARGMQLFRMRSPESPLRQIYNKSSDTNHGNRQFPIGVHDSGNVPESISMGCRLYLGLQSRECEVPGAQHCKAMLDVGARGVVSFHHEGPEGYNPWQSLEMENACW